MKTKKLWSISIVVSVLLALVTVGSVLGQEPEPGGDIGAQTTVGTGFTHQGRLTDGGSPANGEYDFQFRLYDAVSSGSQVGSTNNRGNVTVTEGLFTVQLDFGSGAFNGDARYLEIRVRPGASTGAYTTLTPRQALTPAPYALALPGLWTQQNDTSPNLIGGHPLNYVTPGVVGATIGGGGVSGNTNRVTDDYGTVGGGKSNQAGDNVETYYAGYSATVGGGSANTASGTAATVGGGAGNDARDSYATVGGGVENDASGYAATVPGGWRNIASGDYSFAAGRRARADKVGCFIWADSTDEDFYCSYDNQMRVRANGGATFLVDSTAWKWVRFKVEGGHLIDTSTGAHLTTGGTWVNASDRNAKENLAPVDGQEVLVRLAKVPITTWNYKAEQPTIRHMGPVAQDFYAAFGLGEDERHISTVDAEGVALAAIQALYAQNQDLAAENVALRDQIDALQQQNADFEARLAALERGEVSPVSQLPSLWWLVGGLVVAGGVVVQRRRSGGGR
jgi:hypothetical protein